MQRQWLWRPPHKAPFLSRKKRPLGSKERAFRMGKGAGERGRFAVRFRAGPILRKLPVSSFVSCLRQNWANCPSIEGNQSPILIFGLGFWVLKSRRTSEAWSRIVDFMVLSLVVLRLKYHKHWWWFRIFGFESLFFIVKTGLCPFLARKRVFCLTIKPYEIQNGNRKKDGRHYGEKI